MRPADDAPEIGFSEERALLAQTASDLLAKRCDFAAVRAALASPRGYDPALYRELAELGWLGLSLPGEYGGSELPLSALVSVCEPMGQHVFASPFLATTLAAQALLHAGNQTQRQAHLPELASGRALASLALFEPHGSYEPEHVAATAEPTADGFVLSGTKTSVLDAQHAAFVIVAARLRSELSLFLVPAAELQGRLRTEVLVDETRRSARLDLSGLRVPSAALLDGAEASAALRHVLRLAWLLTAADMAGGAEGVLQLTLDYLRTRKQFGKAIGSYQALKHPMVEIMCAIEEGRSLLYRAATALENAAPDAEIALRMAKAQLGETYTHAADRSIQFHGAIGFTYECHAQLFLRRAQWLEHSFGDARHQRRHLADLLWPPSA
jgi:alkylation response protein AidB-like acyl-CoA dehydrogenase